MINTFKEFLTDSKASLIEVFHRNGRLLTIGAVAMILFVGASLVKAPDKAGIAAGVVLAYFLVFFAFLNARVIIKVIVSIVVLLFSVTMGFQMGILIGQNQGDGLLWFSALFLFYFIGLSVSYWRIQSRSRWGVLTFSTLLNFVVSYIVALVWLNVAWAALAGFIAGSILFIYLNFVSRKGSFRAGEMPMNILVDDLVENMMEGADGSGWSIRADYDSKNNSGNFIAWKERAYLLLPVNMEQGFAYMPTKRSPDSLSYKGNYINPWLVEQVFNNIPFWRTRGANIMLVLLDFKNANGREAKVIGVSLPDSKKMIPVGIVPARSLLNEKANYKFLDKLDGALKKYVTLLSEKQKEALLQYGLSRSEKKTVIEEIAGDFESEVSDSEEQESSTAGKTAVRKKNRTAKGNSTKKTQSKSRRN